MIRKLLVALSVLLVPSLVGGQSIEHLLEVDRDGIPTRTVRMVERLSTDMPTGSAILFTGSFGEDDYYEEGDRWRVWTVDRLLSRGIDVWTVSHPGPEGWATGAEGMGWRVALNIVEDICAYVSVHSRASRIGMQGNSGGAFQVIYGAQIGCVFEVAIASGIPFAEHRGNLDRTSRQCRGGSSTDLLMGLPSGTCQSNELTEDEWLALDAASVLGQPLDSIADLNVINSDGHLDNSVHGWRIFQVAGFPKGLLHIRGAEHAVDNTREGARLIVGLLSSGLGAEHR